MKKLSIFLVISVMLVSIMFTGTNIRTIAADEVPDGKRIIRTIAADEVPDGKRIIRTIAADEVPEGKSIRV